MEAVEYTYCFSTEGQHPYNEAPGYDTKQYDGEVSVLELWEMRSSPSLPSLPGPLKPKMGNLISMGQIQLFDIKLRANK